MKGFVGCPFAEDELVGNLPTEKLVSFCSEKDISHGISIPRFESSFNLALQTFQ
jgi:hydroxymethylglutaryl-CoA lyase